MRLQGAAVDVWIEQNQNKTHRKATGARAAAVGTAGAAGAVAAAGTAGAAGAAGAAGGVGARLGQIFFLELDFFSRAIIVENLF